MLTFFIVFFNFCANAQELTPIPVVAIEYPPFVSEHEPHQGSAVFYLKEFLHAYGWQPELEFLPPARAAIKVTEDTTWMLSYVPPSGDPQAKRLILKEAAIRYGFFRYREKERFYWQDLTELAGKTFITTRQENKNIDAQSFRQAGLKILYVDSLEQGFQMLLAGRADYVLSAEETGYYYLDKFDLPKEYFQFSETLIRTYPYLIYVNTQHPRINDFLNSLDRSRVMN